MTKDIPTVEATTPEAFGALAPDAQKTLYALRDVEAEWEIKQHDTGPMILRLRARAKASQKRATVFLWSLVFTVLVGVFYFAAYPIYTNYLAGQADADRRAQLTSINAEEARLTGEFQGLKSEAVTAALQLWEQESRGPALRGVDFVNPERGWAVGHDGTILATANGGATWTPQTSGTEADLLSSVSFVDAQTGWAVGRSRHDPGHRQWWCHMDAPDQRDGGAIFGPSALSMRKTGWAVGRDGTILATANGGATWTTQTRGTGAPLWSVSFVDAQTGWAVGSLTARSSPRPMVVPHGRPRPAGRMRRILYSVSFVDAQNGWAVGERGTILATANGGATWTPQTSGTEADSLVRQLCRCAKRLGGGLERHDPGHRQWWCHMDAPDQRDG